MVQFADSLHGASQLIATVRHMNGALLTLPRRFGPVDLLGRNKLTWGRASDKRYSDQYSHLGILASGAWDPSGEVGQAYANLALQSETLATAPWARGAGAAIPSDATATVPSPIPGKRSWLCSSSDIGASSGYNQTVAGLASTTVVASFFVKYGNSATGFFLLRDTTASATKSLGTWTWDAARLSLSVAVSTGSANTTIQTKTYRDKPGWVRVIVYFNNWTSGNDFRIGLYCGTIAGTNTHYFTGMQIQTGVICNLYYPTTTLSAGPSPDTFTAPVGLTPFGRSQRTYFILYDQAYPFATYADSIGLFHQSHDLTGGSTDLIAIAKNGNNWRLAITDDSVGVPVIDSAGPAAGRNFVLVSLISGRVFVYINGAVLGSSSSNFAMEGTANLLRIGHTPVAGRELGMPVLAMGVLNRNASIAEAPLLEALVRRASP